MLFFNNIKAVVVESWNESNSHDIEITECAIIITLKNELTVLLCEFEYSESLYIDSKKKYNCVFKMANNNGYYANLSDAQIMKVNFIFKNYWFQKWKYIQWLIGVTITLLGIILGFSFTV